MFVHPGQITEIVKRLPEIQRTRWVILGEMANDQAALKCELGDTEPVGLTAKVTEDARKVD